MFLHFEFTIATDILNLHKDCHSYLKTEKHIKSITQLTCICLSALQVYHDNTQRGTQTPISHIPCSTISKPLTSLLVTKIRQYTRIENLLTLNDVSTFLNKVKTLHQHLSL